MKPVILIVADDRPMGTAIGPLVWHGASDHYVDAVLSAGAVPLLIPAVGSLDSYLEVVPVAGVLLSGGGDVSPDRYGALPSGSVYGVSERRDALEFELVRFCLSEDVPVLGICRGMQVMNVAAGGTLQVDLPSSQRHMDLDHPFDGAHEIVVEEGTLLSDIVGTASLAVNSFHHQAIERLGVGVKTCAHSADGVIEGIELGPRALGVQWHPEMLQSRSSSLLFDWLVGLSIESASARGA